MTHSLRAALPIALLTLLAALAVPAPAPGQDPPEEGAEKTDSSEGGDEASTSSDQDEASASSESGDTEESATGREADEGADADNQAEEADADNQADEAATDEETDGKEGDDSQQSESSESGEADAAGEDSDTDRETGSADQADSTEADSEPASDEAADSESEGDTRPADQPKKQTPSEGEKPEEKPAKPSPSSPPASAGSDGGGEASDTKSDETGEDASPIEGLSSNEGTGDFEPVEDIEEESLQEITPTEVFPYLEWNGLFRVRSTANVNFDLGTEGTSAILPPAGNHLPAGGNNKPAAPDANLLWSTDTELRLDPTLHITESLRLQVEAELLDNLVFGSLSDHRLTGGESQAIRPDPSRTVHSANQIFPREREWFEGSLRINEAYGVVDTFLGTFRAGRMDNDWGLGIAANGGDCLDCDYGDHVDRLEFQTNAFGIYGSASIDFPDQGETSQSPTMIDGQPYDLAQVDDARQYTFSLFRRPVSKKDRELQEQKLKEKEVPVLNGGARFTLRSQNGSFVRGGRSRQEAEGGDAAASEAQLVYRGLNLYVPDLWGQFLYNPDPDTLVRVELEGVGLFGQIDNASTQAVGTADDENPPVNCFDDSERDASAGACSTTADGTSTDQGITQLGGALESELYFGGPVRFGFNTGYASGGGVSNWGYGSTRSEALNFYRFDPNYHVDLILFREVVGTVTNAYYANPYAEARFFESADRRMEAQIDAIASRAVASSGTPAGGENPWLGIELDGSVRYLQMDTFQAGIDGGVLFPFGGLDARLNEERLTTPLGLGGSERFGSGHDASIAWTVQGKLFWQF